MAPPHEGCDRLEKEGDISGMDVNKAQAIFADEPFVEALYRLSFAEEVQAALYSKGLSVSLEEIEAMRLRILADYDELTEPELDKTTGGLGAMLPDGLLSFPPLIANPLAHARW